MNPSFNGGVFCFTYPQQFLFNNIFITKYYIMKHILNDISQEEKNRILEQHTGGKQLMIENFNKLVNNKLGTVKTLISEENIPAGYQDISKWFFSPEGVFYIADGEYVVDGMGDQGTIVTKDGKDTGYLITLVGGVRGSGVRGKLPPKVDISQNGGTITYSLDIDKIYLNNTILDSSGLRKK